jgi:hypothetical protein
MKHHLRLSRTCVAEANTKRNAADPITTDPIILALETLCENAEAASKNAEVLRRLAEANDSLLVDLKRSQVHNEFLRKVAGPLSRRQLIGMLGVFGKGILLCFGCSASHFLPHACLCWSWLNG